MHICAHTICIFLSGAKVACCLLNTLSTLSFFLQRLLIVKLILGPTCLSLVTSAKGDLPELLRMPVQNLSAVRVARGTLARRRMITRDSLRSRDSARKARRKRSPQTISSGDESEGGRQPYQQDDSRSRAPSRSQSPKRHYDRSRSPQSSLGPRK